MAIFLAVDLNVPETQPARNLPVGWIHEFGQICFRASDGSSASRRVPKLRCPLSRRAQGKEILLPRSVPVYGLRTADLSREFARHRSMPTCAKLEALPLGDSRQRP